MSGVWQPSKFGSCAVVEQMLLLLIFIIRVHYGPEADAPHPFNSRSVGLGGKYPEDNSINEFYSTFQEVRMMTFFGFAMSMLFLKNFGPSTVGMYLLLMSFAVQISLVAQNIGQLKTSNEIRLDIRSLIRAEFASTAVLVSFGALVGKTSPFQLLIMVAFETILFAVNEYCGKNLLKVYDVGGSIFVHAFGAYFGLAVSYALRVNDVTLHPKQISDRHSNLLSAIGVLFLWVSWPSFNSIFAVGNEKHRAVINTYICLLSSCITTFTASALLNSKEKLSIVQFRHGTLVGGVAIGASANMMTQPYGAIIIGICCGLLSVFGQIFLMPLLSSSIRVQDTYGVSNLHGIPGVLGGLIGAYMTAIASENNYGKSLYVQFGVMSPVQNSTELYELRSSIKDLQSGFGRSALQQAGYQTIAIVVTLAFATVGGYILGITIRRPFFEPYGANSYFDDKQILQVSPISTDVEK